MLDLWWPEAFSAPLLYTRILFLHQFVVNDPDLIEQVLVTNHQNYRKSHFLKGVLGPVLGEGLLISEGELWRRQRRIAAPAFHHSHVHDFVDAMADAAANRAAAWEMTDGAPFDIAAEMRTLTLDVIVRTMFSADASGQGEAMRQAVDGLAPVMRPSFVDLLGLPSWLRGENRRLSAVVARMDAVVERILASRRADGVERGDLYSLLLAARDPETGEGMSARQLRDEVMTIFLAGHDTTANALSWTWYLLGQHPEIAERLYDEVDRVLGGRRPTAADLNDLAYTKMVFLEAMRLFPPAHLVSRTAIAEDRLGSRTIPKGSVLTLSPYLTQRNPRLWPDPDRFDPERFTSEAVAARHRFAYFPFGGGPRICIGMSFAMVEAQIIIASIIQRFRLRPAPGRTVAPVAMVTLRPSTGVWMIRERR